MNRIRLREQLFQLATGRNVLLLFSLFFVLMTVIMPAIEADIKAFSGGTGVIDLQPFYSAETARTMLESYGPEGIKIYIAAQWTADLVFPLAGGLFYATLLIWLGDKKWWPLAFGLPIMDWIENIFVTVMLVQWPDFQPIVAWISCFFTVLKWLFIVLVSLLAIVRGVQKLLAARSQSRTTTA